MCIQTDSIGRELPPQKRFRLGHLRRRTQTSPTDHNRLAPTVIKDYDVTSHRLGLMQNKRVFGIERKVRNLRQFTIASFVTSVVRSRQIGRQPNTSPRIVVISRMGFRTIATDIVMLGTLHLAKRTIVWKPINNIAVMMMWQY